MTLNSRQETFCHAYASGANGTQAARQAGYGTAGAANQASRLLQNPDVAERIGEFHADAAAARTEAAQSLMDKLEPVYQTGLDSDDVDTVLQVVELQARIAGLISGGSLLPRRVGRPDVSDPSQGHMEFIRMMEEEADAAKAEAELAEAEAAEAEAEMAEAEPEPGNAPECL